MMRRIGRFQISDQLGDHPAIRVVLSRCDVIEKKYHPAVRWTEYVAYSPDFEPADMADDPPRYDWMIHTQPDGTFTVEARRYVPDPDMQARIARMLQDPWDQKANLR